MSKTYNSVVEMLSDMGMDNVAAVEKRIRSHSIATAMIIARTKANITQVELAEKLGVKLNWVEKIEDTENEFLTVADIEKYYKGLGMDYLLKVLPL